MSGPDDRHRMQINPAWRVLDGIMELVYDEKSAPTLFITVIEI
jgi:hypothetical protein